MEEEEPEEKKKPWWKGGGAAAGKKHSDFVTPSDWLNTDMREGLNAVEIERRRKAAGWNELSAEKENMVSLGNTVSAYQLPTNSCPASQIHRILPRPDSVRHGGGCHSGLRPPGLD